MASLRYWKPLKRLVAGDCEAQLQPALDPDTSACSALLRIQRLIDKSAVGLENSSVVAPTNKVSMGKGQRRDKQKSNTRGGRSRCTQEKEQQQRPQQGIEEHPHHEETRVTERHMSPASDLEVKISREMSPATLYQAARKVQITANKAKDSARLIRQKYEDTIDHGLGLDGQSNSESPRKRP
ncbi:hypothetical protein SERLA73DRAFT_150603 [Serpula lacrymans var. lacrymans S7.3]|uniref:Uncharacterized protein n=2 Tax=Serpula lacrymans var. lacrymans TaxID=341189 RepID=F8PNB2_SERL3|nr:uncharacterized protein SERLADRAFT_406238 [Serpula lacrymans var. lacrymans S7.9]EGO03094.1 hypothetical protein SERLA73DRAFT_150603 [Serpula lacrymans var. lacrymans S7.3]EGO28857.1 hypothetical protein SERLADRAFT_406238 [Serpula lacrymans var. lacrymans S7.9]